MKKKTHKFRVANFFLLYGFSTYSPWLPHDTNRNKIAPFYKALFIKTHKKCPKLGYFTVLVVLQGAIAASL